MVLFRFSMELLFLLVISLLILLIFVKHRYRYWKRRGIIQIEPTFPFGNMKDVFLKKLNSVDCFQELYQYIKDRKQPFGGYYSILRPNVLVIDPKLIKQVLIKDFQYFTDRSVYIDEKNDPLSAHLFSLGGAKWRNMRSKLSPTFTSGKMKMMFNTLVATSEEFNNILEMAAQKAEPLNIKDLLARLTTDIIGSCAFGIDCNCLKNPDTEFRQYSSRFFVPTNTDVFKRALATLFPKLMTTFRIPLTDPEISGFFMNVVKDTVKYREDNNIIRKDFLQLLLELRTKGKLSEDDTSRDDNIDVNDVTNDEKITIEQIAAQCFLFFLAGFETSSTTMAYCLYELTQNPAIQEKLRNEIITVLKKYNGELTYEAIMEMQFLDQVLSETLRKYPVVPILIRRCTKDYMLPNTTYTMKKGESVRISVFGIHRDPDYYPDPEKFDPGRFSELEKNKRPACTYLPFGDGPRNCIGLRFGLMQAKVGITVLLKNYRITLNSKTQVPLVMDPDSVVLSPKGGIWLDVQKVVP